jgi:dephospho-CoA kinase
MPKKLPVIGVYALAGAGKSLASSFLAEFTGWHVISADELTHQVLKQEDIKVLLKSYFGSKIFTRDHEIDRLALGLIVFQSTSSKALLERCVWPAIEKAILKELNQVTNGAIIDAAVLVRARWHKHCHHLIYIESKEGLRIHRLFADRGKTEAQARLVFQMQKDIAKSKVKADYIVQNNGTTAELKRKMEKIAKELLLYFPARSTSKTAE